MMGMKDDTMYLRVGIVELDTAIYSASAGERGPALYRAYKRVYKSGESSGGVGDLRL